MPEENVPLSFGADPALSPVDALRGGFTVRYPIPRDTVWTDEAAAGLVGKVVDVRGSTDEWGTPDERRAPVLWRAPVLSARLVSQSETVALEMTFGPAVESEDEARAAAAAETAAVESRVRAQARKVADEIAATFGLPDGVSVEWDETPLGTDSDGRIS